MILHPSELWLKIRLDVLETRISPAIFTAALSSAKFSYEVDARSIFLLFTHINIYYIYMVMLFVQSQCKENGSLYWVWNVIKMG